MLDVFQNQALVSVLFYFIVGLPKTTSGSGSDTTSNRPSKMSPLKDDDLSSCGSRVKLGFSGKGKFMGFSLKRQNTVGEKSPDSLNKKLGSSITPETFGNTFATREETP